MADLSPDCRRSTLGTIATKTAVQDFGNMVLDELAVDFVWTRWGLAPNGEVYAAPHRDRSARARRDIPTPKEGT